MSKLLQPSRVEYDAKTMGVEIEKLQQFLTEELHLCGGWTKEIEENFSPRTFGTILMEDEEYCKLKAVSEHIGKIYLKIAALAQSSSALRERLIGDKPKEQQEMYRKLCKVSPPDINAVVMRPDIIIESGTKLPKIIEVNVGNCAGIEDINLYINYYIEKYEDSEISNTLRNWLNIHNSQLASLFRKRLNINSTERANIAILYEDTDESFFTAKYLSHILRSQGIEAYPCRPEHLTTIGRKKQLFMRKPYNGRIPIGGIYMHLLPFEMYTNKLLQPKFEQIIEAIYENSVSTIIPLGDNLLNGKDLLAELGKIANETGGVAKEFLQLELSGNEKEFIREHIVATTIIEFQDNLVTKPANGHGGHGVIIGSENQKKWIQQPIIHSDSIRVLYRRTNLEQLMPLDLNIVHGPLVYSISENATEMGVIMTRLGPDPVVNWSQGAQPLPCINLNCLNQTNCKE